MTLITFAAAAEGVCDRRLTVDDGDREATGIEMIGAEERRGASAVDPVSAGAHRIDHRRGGHGAPAGDATDVAADDALQRGRPARREIDHAAAAGMPGVGVVPLDVRVEAEREEGAVHLGEVDRRGDPPEWIVARLLVRLHADVLRMQPRVALGQARHDGVLVDEQRVPGDQIAPVDALTDEHRVLVRPVVVGDIQLVEASIDPGELERRAAKLQRAPGARHPIRGVARREHEIDGRGLGGVGHRGSTAGSGAEQDRERQRSSERGERKHRWEI